MTASFKAVFFDAGGTLFRPYPSVGHIYEKVSRRYGCRIPGARLEELFHEAWLKRDGLKGLASHSSEKVEKHWWRDLVGEVFSKAGPIENFEEFFEELYDVFGSPESWQLFPDTVEVLSRLKQEKKILGIVSNWDSRLFHLCDGLGLSPYFDFVLASAVFGAAKPNPRICQEALDRAGAAAHESIHIGDSYQDDILGAAGIGMRAVLVDRKVTGSPRNHETFKGVPVIHDLNELFGH